MSFGLTSPYHATTNAECGSGALALLRPATLMFVVGYRTIWRFLRVQDVALLLFASIPPSLLLLVLRLTMRHVSWIADVPRGVIALEFAMLTGLAAGMRGFRRAVYEESLVSSC